MLKLIDVVSAAVGKGRGAKTGHTKRMLPEGFGPTDTCPGSSSPGWTGPSAPWTNVVLFFVLGRMYFFFIEATKSQILGNESYI